MKHSPSDDANILYGTPKSMRLNSPPKSKAGIPRAINPFRVGDKATDSTAKRVSEGTLVVPTDPVEPKGEQRDA